MTSTPDTAPSDSRLRRALPGDLPEKAAVGRMLRVDHAGEYGARRIYAGQLAVLGGRQCTGIIRKMAEQEEEHLAAFGRLMKQRHVRPTALMPLWHVAGYAVGALTALLGEKAAMACTVAVESVIGEHYARQETALPDGEAALKQTIAQFREDEMEHHHTGLEHGAEDTPFYHALTQAIRLGTRGAIWLSERV